MEEINCSIATYTVNNNQNVIPTCKKSNHQYIKGKGKGKGISGRRDRKYTRAGWRKRSRHCGINIYKVLGFMLGRMGI